MKNVLVFLSALGLVLLCDGKTITEVEPNGRETYTDSLGLLMTRWQPQRLGELGGSYTIVGELSSVKDDKENKDLYHFIPNTTGDGTVSITSSGQTLEWFDCSYFASGCSFDRALSETRHIYRIIIDSTVQTVRLIAGRTYYLRVTGALGKYTINLKLPGAPVAATYTVIYRRGAYGSGTETWATKTQDKPLALKGAIFTRSGYVQKGWSTQADGTVKSYALNGSFTLNQNINLCPYWEKGTDTLQLSKSSDTGHDYRKFSSSFTVTASSSWTLMQSITADWLHVTRSGNTVSYTVDQNNTSSTRSCTFTVRCGQASATCQVTQAGRTLSVVYNANGGTIGGGTTKTCTDCTPSMLIGKSSYIPTRSGYSFDGWYTASTGGKLIADDTKLSELITDSQTTLNVYAHWISTTRYVTVTWYANGGRFDCGGTASSGSYAASSSFGSIETPSRTGYAFLGWYTQPSGGTKITSSTIVSSVVGTSATEASFYAQWAAVSKPNLTFLNPAGWRQSVFLFWSPTLDVEENFWHGGYDIFSVGDKIYLYNCFINDGRVATSGGFKIRHEVLNSSSQVIRSTTADIGSLGAGASLWYNGCEMDILQGLTAGRYTYRCILDCGGSVSEGDESDNVWTYDFEVMDPDGFVICTSGKTAFGTIADEVIIEGTAGENDAKSFTFVAGKTGTVSVWMDSPDSEWVYLNAVITDGDQYWSLVKTDQIDIYLVKGTVYTVRLFRSTYSSGRQDADIPFEIQIGGSSPYIEFVDVPSFTATAKSASIDLRWSPVSGATKYHIYRMPIHPERGEKVGGVFYGSHLATVPAGTTFYSDTHISQDWNYRYHLRAESAQTVSHFSDASEDIAPLPPTVSLEGDANAKVGGSADRGYTITPSADKTEVDVTIPENIAADNVTVEIGTNVTRIKPNGATVKIVKGGYDITSYLNIPDADVNGEIDLTKAQVRDDFVQEALSPEWGAVIEMNAASPSLTTSLTRPGLTYTLREGTSLKGMNAGDSKVGNGLPWTPNITVKGGSSGFYTIEVTK